MKFIAESLEDIADSFDQQAKVIASKATSGRKLVKERLELDAEARGWRAAADQLRNTELRKS